MIVIGIVGPPAGGKSTVAAMLGELGAAWANADRMAHAALRLRRVRSKLVQRFGAQVIDAQGRIDRKRLAKFVFGDDPTSGQSLEYIEEIIHPVVLELTTRKITRWKVLGAKAIVLDAPLLIEAHWHFYCDEVWYIDSPWSERVRWATPRGWAAEHLQQRQQCQLDLNEKRRHSNRTIDNSQSLENTRRQILAAWTELKLITAP